MLFHISQFDCIFIAYFLHGAGLDSLNLSMTPETCRAYHIVVLDVSARYAVGELYIV